MPELNEYTKTVWEDLPSEETPINAENLNKIENQIEAITNDVMASNLLTKIIYKGEVALLTDLPSTNQKIGDYYIVVEKGVPYLWNGTEFKPQVVIPEIPEGGETAQSIGTLISSADAKATPHDNDTFGYSDSQDVTNPNRLKKMSWANFISEFKTYFDTLYATITNLNLKAPITNPTFIGTQTLPNIVTNGVKFPTTQVPSADPNTLDDYEEGTFTPSLQGSGVSYSLQRGRYVKIGKEVHCSMAIEIASIGTLTGNLITGLPFAVEYDSGASIAQIYNLILSSGYTYHAFRATAGSTSLRVLQVSGITYDYIPISGFKSGMEIFIDFIYQTST